MAASDMVVTAKGVARRTRETLVRSYDIEKRLDVLEIAAIMPSFLCQHSVCH
jgi:hypothetical protein